MGAAMNKQPNKNRSSAGESMVMVVVMLMVILILGGAVLTAAASSTAVSSARVIERQTYYYGRSALDVLDESMRNGKLGEAVRQKMLDELVAREISSIRYTADAPLTLTYSANVTAEPLSQIEFSDITISVTGLAESGTTSVGMGITQASLQLRTVDMRFSIEYKGQSIVMHIQYRSTCNVENYDASSKTGTWAQSWTIQQVG